MNRQKVGVIGVGMMGHGIALNILKNGYPLTFLDHPGNQPVGDLIALGAKPGISVADVAKFAEVIILCVTGTPQVEAVVYGEDGLLSNLRPGTVVIDCSTAIPSSSQRIAHDIESKGGRFMDAPMTRTPKEAAAGRLNLIVGSEESLFEQQEPLLRAFAENVTYAGAVGSGHQMKLLHNFVSMGFAAILAEAAACAGKSGVGKAVFLEVLSKGGGDGVVLNRMRPYIESGDDSGFRFSLPNGLKDLTYYHTMAEQAGAYSVMAQAAKNTFAEGASQEPQATIPELVRLLKK